MWGPSRVHMQPAWGRAGVRPVESTSFPLVAPMGKGSSLSLSGSTPGERPARSAAARRPAPRRSLPRPGGSTPPARSAIWSSRPSPRRSRSRCLQGTPHSSGRRLERASASGGRQWSPAGGQRCMARNLLAIPPVEALSDPARLTCRSHASRVPAAGLSGRWQSWPSSVGYGPSLPRAWLRARLELTDGLAEFSGCEPHLARNLPNSAEFGRNLARCWPNLAHSCQMSTSLG